MSERTTVQFLEEQLRLVSGGDFRLDETFFAEVRNLLDCHAAMTEKYQSLVEFYDKQVGTPCEEIRHQQEVDSLKERHKENARHGHQGGNE